MPTSNLRFNSIVFQQDQSLISSLQAEETRRSSFVKNTVYSGGGGSDSNYGGGVIKPQNASKSIKEIYIPAINKALPDISRGLRALMTAQVQVEGFYPGSKSYRSNNPGNVGTHGHGANAVVRSFPTLEEGIKAQWDKVLKGALNNTSAYYKSSFSLYKYLSTYAPPSDGNSPTSYTNIVLGLMKKQGINITAETTLEEISKIN